MTPWSSVRRLARSVGRVLRTHYPGFLFGRPLRPGAVPVFVYHDVEAEQFAGDLAYLRANGYRTLVTDEFLGRVGRPDAGRAVLLTFDDARRNFWEVAFPLLREHEARAALFVPTYWIGGGGAASRREAGQPERDGFMTWEQLRACASSGHVDVQAHGHRHALVYRSPRVEGFASPSLLRSRDLFEWPLRREDGRDVLGPPSPGTPILEATPLFSADRRVLEDPAAVEACREEVEAGGGEAFFGRRGWAARLWWVYRRALRGSGGVSPVQPADLRSLIAMDLARCRDRLGAELGEPPRCLAFPWWLGHRHALGLAADLGFRAAFGVALDVHRIRRMDAPLRVHGRVKAQWMRCLPGEGRQRFEDRLPALVRRFAASQHLAH